MPQVIIPHDVTGTSGSELRSYSSVQYWRAGYTITTIVLPLPARAALTRMVSRPPERPALSPPRSARCQPTMVLTFYIKSVRTACRTIPDTSPLPPIERICMFQVELIDPVTNDYVDLTDALIRVEARMAGTIWNAVAARRQQSGWTCHHHCLSLHRAHSVSISPARR